MSITFVSFYINVACIIIPVSTGLCYMKYLDKPSKILLWSLILGFLQASLTIFDLNNKQPVASEWIENLYTIIDILLMVLFYFAAIDVSRIRKILIAVTIILIVAFILSIIFKPSINFLPSLQSLVFNVTTLFFFGYLMKNSVHKSLIEHPLFWINCGFFLNTIILVLRIYSGALMDDSFKYYQQLYVFFCMSGISSNILYTIGFIKSKRYKLSKSRR